MTQQKLEPRGRGLRTSHLVVCVCRFKQASAQTSERKEQTRSSQGVISAYKIYKNHLTHGW